MGAKRRADSNKKATDANASDGAMSDAERAAMDRRLKTERRKGERRKRDVAVAAERRKQPDRRQSDRRAKRSMNQYDLEEDTLEFIRAINRFKESSGRSFPTWSEVLSILRDLGYEKTT